jgi:hypothetical protein
MKIPVCPGRIFNHRVHGVSRKKRRFHAKIPCFSVSSVVHIFWMYPRKVKLGYRKADVQKRGIG